MALIQVLNISMCFVRFVSKIQVFPEFEIEYVYKRKTGIHDGLRFT